MVVAGREQLQWDQWDEVDEHGRQLWLEEHSLAGLSSTDAMLFLQRDHAVRWPGKKFDMADDLCGAILRITNEERDERASKRHHCYHLAMCMEIVQNAVDAVGVYPPASNFNSISPGNWLAEITHRSFSGKFT